jgi:predicted house-cleaning noncanonical NTP pyrophosphatase (MazG superfamily)
LAQEYNKAIRDKIPEVIRAKGLDCEVRQLSDPEFLAELERKLDEEVQEFRASKTAEELVDIVEVAYRIAELRGVDKSNFDKIRGKKIEDRGAFAKNLFLVKTYQE